jgi:hypothetical protein
LLGGEFSAQLTNNKRLTIGAKRAVSAHVDVIARAHRAQTVVFIVPGWGQDQPEFFDFVFGTHIGSLLIGLDGTIV